MARVRSRRRKKSLRINLTRSHARSNPLRLQTRATSSANTRSSVEFVLSDAPFSAPASLPLLKVPASTLPLDDVVFHRQRFISGAAVNKNVVRPTANMMRLEYVTPAVLTCVRRKQRKEVLFATGGVKKVKRKPHWKSDSYINC